MKTRLQYALLTLLIAAACKSGEKRNAEFYKDLVQHTEKADAVGVLTLTADGTTAGSAVFVIVGAAKDKTVGFGIEVKNLSPGMHALHLHEFGSCSNNGADAGGHWNPNGKPHGQRGMSEAYHAGDVINLTADQSGTAFWYGDITGWTIGDSSSSNVVGKSVVVHAGQDDYTSQPSGNAGARVACGVVSMSNK